ncbi:hypothetical protein CRG98_046525 [Punica granatum]|uniref:RlpA-like protein double-psi beta-barrel domain-containing protein n=1 Tax=Punica granatum TaxID=22663 RepID=A0A2I0HMX6_PUNGR|nr:hypothetical protein CRG98_046525 [Punica granatum]
MLTSTYSHVLRRAKRMILGSPCFSHLEPIPLKTDPIFGRGRVAVPATRSGASMGASAPAQAVNIIVTDECPRRYCSKRRVHFDLSGAAFGRMAISSEGG